jgi:hypothetical protein
MISKTHLSKPHSNKTVYQAQSRRRDVDSPKQIDIATFAKSGHSFSGALIHTERKFRFVPLRSVSDESKKSSKNI